MSPAVLNERIDPRRHDALHEALTAAANDYVARTDVAAAIALRRRLRRAPP